MKFARISILVLLGIIAILLVIYDVKFNDDNYDILLHNRFTGLGFGIDYKKGFEIWIFAHTVHGGIAERRWWPSD